MGAEKLLDWNSLHSVNCAEIAEGTVMDARDDGSMRFGSFCDGGSERGESGEDRFPLELLVDQLMS